MQDFSLLQGPALIEKMVKQAASQGSREGEEDLDVLGREAACMRRREEGRGRQPLPLWLPTRGTCRGHTLAGPPSAVSQL